MGLKVQHIGVALMNESLAKLNNDDDAFFSSNEAKQKHIAIFGHSMGSKSALLYYASHQKQDIVPNLVVLVAPAY